MKLSNIKLILPGKYKKILKRPTVFNRLIDPSAPSKMSDRQYLYNSSDPFSSNLDEVEASSEVYKITKLWVKVTWFIVYILSPIFYGLALSASMYLQGILDYWVILFFILIGVAVITPYIILWRKKPKSKIMRNKPNLESPDSLFKTNKENEKVKQWSNYKVYHLHELEKLLLNFDEVKKPDEASYIRKLILKGGYKYHEHD